MTWWIWLTIGIIIGIAVGRHGLSWVIEWVKTAITKIYTKITGKTL